MVIFEQPKETEGIEIMGIRYEVDLTDFNVLTEIKNMPTLSQGFSPTDEQLSFHLEQLQNLFTKILGKPLLFPERPKAIQFYHAKSYMVKLYQFLTDKQAEYLNLEYGVKKDELETLRLYAEIAKAGVLAGKSDSNTN